MVLLRNLRCGNYVKYFTNATTITTANQIKNKFDTTYKVAKPTKITVPTILYKCELHMLGNLLGQVLSALPKNGMQFKELIN